MSEASSYQYDCADDCDPNGPDIRDHAWMWSNVAIDLEYLDDDYCQRIGAMDLNGNCGPSDAVLPTWAQSYPGSSGFQQRSVGRVRPCVRKPALVAQSACGLFRRRA